MAAEKHIREEVNTPSSLTPVESEGGLHHDHVAAEALGGRTQDLGKSYYTSINFIGTVIVSCSRM